MSEDLGSAVLTLRADGKPLDADLDGAERGTQQRMKSMGVGLAKTGGALTLGLTAPILAFGKIAGEELESIEQANNATAKSLARMGADSRVSVAGVRDLAGELQNLSGLDDQLIQMGQNAILTFGGIDTATKQGAAAFDEASRVMMNFAEASGMSVDRAGQQIAKSMADASRGVLTLPRGTKLAADEQAKLEKVLKGTGSAADKQAALLEVLGEKVSGAANLTKAEKWAIVQDRFAGIGAVLLEKLLPAFDKLVDWLGVGLTAFENLDGGMQTAVAVTLALVGAVGPLLLLLGGFGMALGAISAPLIAVAVGIGVVVAALVMFGDDLLRLWRTNESFRDGVMTIWNAVRSAVTEVLDSLQATISVWVGWATSIWAQYGSQIRAYALNVWEGIRGIVTGSLQIVKGVIKTFLAVLRGDWSAAWDGVKLILSGAWTIIKTTVKNGGTAIKDALSATWSAVKSGTSSAWNGIKDTVRNAITSLPGIAKEALKDLIDAMRKGGENAGKALANALKGAVNAVIDKVRNFALPEINVLGKKIAGGQTPFSGIPRLAAGGIVTSPTLALIGEGRESEAVIPLSKLDAMLSGGTGGGATVHVHPKSGDPVAIAREVARILSSGRVRVAGVVG